MKANYWLSGLALIGTSACTMSGEPMTSRPAAAAAAANPTPTDAATYVTKAGASDLYEIQSSQLALEKSQNEQLRSFAQMLIAHHTQTTQTVMAAAKQAGMNPPPPALEPMQAQMIAELRPLSGQAFDRAFSRQQVTAHQMALALHQTFSTSGDSEPLRAAAGTAVPIVQQHLSQAQSMPM